MVTLVKGMSLHGSFLVNDFKRHAVFSVVCFCTRRKAMDNLLSTASISNKNQMILEFSALHLTNRRKRMAENYSIVKDSSADLGVNFKIVQNRPTVKAVCTKISKNFFCIFVNIFVFLRENKEVSFFIF